MKFVQAAQFGFVVLAAVAVFGFVQTAKDAEARHACGSMCGLRPTYAANDRRAPDFELATMTGGKARLSDYRGKVVILNFWTKSCQPCLEEMPSLVDLAKMLQGRPNIALVTITTDDSAEDAQATMKSVLGGTPPFQVLIDPEGAIVTGKFGTKLYPETWFIDPQGIIRARFDGGRNWAEPIVVELAESLRAPLDCKVEFSRAQPTGTFAGLCDDFAR